MVRPQIYIPNPIQFTPVRELQNPNNPPPTYHHPNYYISLLPSQSETNKSQAPPTTSALALSLLTSLGGIIGYTRTGSIPSIAAGISVGLVYLLSFLRLRAGQSYGEELGLLASAVLGGSSVPRVIKTGGKPVPVVLSVLATYGLYVFGVAYKQKTA
ncbi:hypothetical protein N7491_002511 [Penicillium cf. griseofulvum]|uniref:Uncharacterized protein n=1 Tax=Penicillium cf. griseofulvum TaxID=2972120 RepID=A0A9W9T2H4_9EURO|nr:hypothetical protein N7472_003304 [Penicillium cf. griseofulvum]KAJ5446429.1 hypothetical protein N7491_002511 [Penicillium cf. griseofulvum]KAJ5448169.1 hypothetical protein N7445_002990 [Penicillium cf. griseofulvum]